MARNAETIRVYLEIGKKRTLAGALEWPGWCRAGRDEDSALQALLDYEIRYERVVHAAGVPFKAPTSVAGFTVTERLQGNATTDFGAPDMSPSADALAVDAEGLEHLQTMLQACWSAFDAAVAAAQGKELSKGPRGGGRELEGIIDHVMGAEASYLVRLGGKRPDRKDGESGSPDAVSRQRKAVLDALSAAARGEFPAQGPRGGARWTPRFFVRRDAWHVLDHAWEIEDRVVVPGE